MSTQDHRALADPAPVTPPGAFVSGELRDDCARFLAEVHKLAQRRARQLESPPNRGNTVKQE